MKTILKMYLVLCMFLSFYLQVIYLCNHAPINRLYIFIHLSNYVYCTYQSIYVSILLITYYLFTEEQLKIDFEKAIAAIKSGEDAHKFVDSATHIADSIEELVVAEINKSDDPQLKRDLTIAKDTLHKRKIISDIEIKSSCKLLYVYTIVYL